MDEGDFAGVADVVEHAFTEEGGAEADAVESAGELAILPCFDAVGEAEFVEVGVGGDKLFADPSSLGTIAGAGAHDRGKIVVEADFKTALLGGFCDQRAERMGDVEGVERHDAARVGGVPPDSPIAAGHGKETLGVAGEKSLGIEGDRAGHGG